MAKSPLNDPAVRESVLESIRGGSSLASAATYAGVSDKALRNWRDSHKDFAGQIYDAKKRSKSRTRRGARKPVHDIVLPGIIIAGSSPAPRTREEAMARLDTLLWAIAEDKDHKSNAAALGLLHKDLRGPGIAGRVATAVRVAQAEPVMISQAPPEPMVFAAIPANGSEAPGRGPAKVIDLEPEPDEEAS